MYANSIFYIVIYMNLYNMLYKLYIVITKH